LLDNAVDVRGGGLEGQLKHTLIDKVLAVEETDAAAVRLRGMTVTAPSR